VRPGFRQLARNPWWFECQAGAVTEMMRAPDAVAICPGAPSVTKIPLNTDLTIQPASYWSHKAKSYADTQPSNCIFSAPMLTNRRTNIRLYYDAPSAGHRAKYGILPGHKIILIRMARCQFWSADFKTSSVRVFLQKSCTLESDNHSFREIAEDAIHAQFFHTGNFPRLIDRKNKHLQSPAMRIRDQL
jgi:hypothetical protein